MTWGKSYVLKVEGEAVSRTLHKIGEVWDVKSIRIFEEPTSRAYQ